MSKKVMELALDAIEKWDATIAYQHSGSNAGVLSRKDAMLAGRAAMAALKEAIEMQQDDEKCKKCGGIMSPGKAIQQTWSAGVPDFPGDQLGITMSPGGVGKLIDCLKCNNCGFSITDVGLGGTIWGYGEDNDGWYVGPPGEQIGYAISESDAKRIVACVNACTGIHTDVLNINGVLPNQ